MTTHNHCTGTQGKRQKRVSVPVPPLFLIQLLLVILFFASYGSAKFWNDGKVEDEPVDYGVDVSFPMQYAQVSTNYPWLPHNQDPTLPVPPEYKDMVLQPLGNRDEFYKEFLNGCRDAFGKKGTRCTQNELVSFQKSNKTTWSLFLSFAVVVIVAAHGIEFSSTFILIFLPRFLLFWPLLSQNSFHRRTASR